MITDQLLELLSEQDVVIRKESMNGDRAGLCCIKGQKTLIYDPNSSVFDIAVCCAEACGALIEDLESIYLRPAVRDFIDKYGQEV